MSEGGARGVGQGPARASGGQPRGRGGLLGAFAWTVAWTIAVRREPWPRGARRVCAAGLGLAVGGALVAVGGAAGGLAAGWSAAAAVLAGVGALVAGLAAAWGVFGPSLAVASSGVALACASLATTSAVADGFEAALVRAVTRLHGHVLLTRYGLDFTDYERIADDALRDPRVVGASPFAYAMVGIVAERTADAAAANGADADDPAVIAVAKGLDPWRAAGFEGLEEAFVGGDLAALRPADVAALPGVALGESLARRLRVGVGDRVRIVTSATIDGRGDPMSRPPRWASFAVTDLVRSGLAELDDSVAIVHLSAAQAVFFGERRVTGIELQLRRADDSDAVAQALRGALGYPYRTSTWREGNDATLTVLRQVRATILVLMGLILVVAAASLIGALLLLVRRRRAEIAVWVALGASAREVFAVFEAVGLLVAGAGVAAGTVLACSFAGLLTAVRYPLAGDVYPVDHLPVALGAWHLLVPAAIALTVCGLVTGPVAWLAATQPVVPGLRRG